MRDLIRRLLDGARAGLTVDVAGEVPAELLLQILTSQTKEPVHPRGVRLRGARVVGRMDWQWQNLTAPLQLIECDVDEIINLDHAKVAGLSFRDCRLTGFSGEHLTSHSHVRFDGSDVRGPIILRGAELRGLLIATGATVRAGEDGVALNAVSLVAGAGVSLARGFTAHGSTVLRGARIGNALNCDGGHFLAAGGDALNATSSVVDGFVAMRSGFLAVGRVRLLAARITRNLDCSGGEFRGIDDDEALWVSSSQIGENVLMNGLVCNGRVRMNNLTIDGRLDLHEATLNYRSGTALSAMRLEVRGNVDLSTLPGQTATTVQGTLVLEGSHIRGSLLLDGMTVKNAGDVAVDAQDVHVGDNLRMGSGFSAEGEVRLTGIRISGYMDCGNSSFSNPGGMALELANAEVADSALLRPNLRVEGELNVRRARFSSTLELEGATLTNPGGRAFAGTSVNVARALWIRDSAVIGSVHLDSARIDGDLNLMNTTLHDDEFAFDGEGMSVAGSLRWGRMPKPPSGRVDWRRASVSELDDDESGWPRKGLLQLGGFRYERFSDRAPRTVAQRLKWIRLQQGYASEPYQQLAELYRSTGQVAEATTVGMAQQDDLVRLGDLTRPARLWKRFLGLTIGHGYRPGRAAWLLLFLYLVTAGTVWIGAQHDAFIQVGETAPRPAVTSSHCADDYPCFSVEAYALENITPFINLHQAENWHPKSSNPWELALRDWLYLCTVAGYAGATLLAAGLSGLARNSY